MRRCLQLAANGKGFTAPNPMVGSLIVHKSKIIGEGFHQVCGKAHAEVNAIGAVKDSSLLKESTLFVNLEPCAHFGKTPPCASLIIEKQIPKIVIGMQDPFAKVGGKGIQLLKEAGIEVVVGVLEPECRELNKRFLTFHEKKRPYIILKWAQSADNFIDKIRINDKEAPIKFSNEYTQLLVHKLRAEEAAIIVGTNTMRLDKPRLNVRYWDGSNPVRMIADSKKPLFDLMKECYDKHLQSLIVEGGSKLLQSFINENLWDEARIEIKTDLCLDKGIPAPKLNGRLKNVHKCKNSILMNYYSINNF